MHGEARRLVDDQQMRVAVQDGEGQIGIVGAHRAPIGRKRRRNSLKSFAALADIGYHGAP